jgi:hypothetical protein
MPAVPIISFGNSWFAYDEIIEDLPTPVSPSTRIFIRYSGMDYGAKDFLEIVAFLNVYYVFISFDSSFISGACGGFFRFFFVYFWRISYY